MKMVHYVRTPQFTNMQTRPAHEVDLYVKFTFEIVLLYKSQTALNINRQGELIYAHSRASYSKVA